MIDFFRSREARELADILNQRDAKAGAVGSQRAPFYNVQSDDLEYFTLRCCKHIELAAKAASPAARNAHLELADLHGARAREAMGIAMRTNASSYDVRAAAMLRLDMDIDLNELLGTESAEKFRSLRVE